MSSAVQHSSRRLQQREEPHVKIFVAVAREQRAMAAVPSKSELDGVLC